MFLGGKIAYITLNILITLYIMIMYIERERQSIIQYVYLYNNILHLLFIIWFISTELKKKKKINRNWRLPEVLM